MADAPTGEPLPGLDTTLGIVFHVITPELVEGTLKVGPELFQPAGLVHGGVYASFAESVSSVGAHFAVADSGKTVLGISNSTSFIRPVSDGSIRAFGKPIHRGRTTWVWDVDMKNDDGKLCAVSRVTVAIR